jgi:hypothetical protein
MTFATVNDLPSIRATIARRVARLPCSALYICAWRHSAFVGHQRWRDAKGQGQPFVADSLRSAASYARLSQRA